VKLDVPPLRERGSDVLELADHFLAQIAARTGRPVYRVSSAAAAKLVAHSWPGNVRELENCMERAVVVARFEEISIEDLPEDIRAYSNAHRAAPRPAAEIIPILEVERAHIVHALELVKGNKVRAARALGVDRRTLYRKLARFGISTDAFKGVRS
jgi:DNA-binding NtrC family response regulator